MVSVTLEMWRETLGFKLFTIIFTQETQFGRWKSSSTNFLPSNR